MLKHSSVRSLSLSLGLLSGMKTPHRKLIGYVRYVSSKKNESVFMQQNITSKKNITNETYTQKNTSNNNNKTDSKWMIQKRQHLKADEH